jgi:hypothetical protein
LWRSTAYSPPSSADGSSGGSIAIVRSPRHAGDRPQPLNGWHDIRIVEIDADHPHPAGLGQTRAHASVPNSVSNAWLICM